MIPDPEGKTESVKSDPGDLARVPELELLQKRAARLRTNARLPSDARVEFGFVVSDCCRLSRDALSSLFNLERTASVTPSTNIDDEARGMKLCGMAASRRLRMQPELVHLLRQSRPDSRRPGTNR
jgi:hypothetical protein